MQDPFISKLEKHLQDTLPGQEAQYKMAHGVRKRTSSPPINARKAGVLALLYPKHTDWHIVFIERPHHPDDRHSGQISFPGGKQENGDSNLANTALREAEEEIGVPTTMVHLLGNLTELYIPVSNFLVAPYVGFAEQQPRFSPQPSEVHAILEVPLKQFLLPSTQQKIDLKITDKLTLRQVPYFDIQNKVIWGATAMMLNELIEVVKKI